MENATKALLIAAAVLIAILIISLGLVVYNKASEVMGSVDMTEYQIQQFNNKFKKYAGTTVSGTDVNAMLETVFNHNNAQEDNSTCVEVEVTGKTNSSITAKTGIENAPETVSVGSRYKVECHYSSKTGLIDKITVTEK